MPDNEYSQWNLGPQELTWADKLLRILTLTGLGILVGFGMGLGLWVFQALGVLFGR